MANGNGESEGWKKEFLSKAVHTSSAAGVVVAVIFTLQTTGVLNPVVSADVGATRVVAQVDKLLKSVDDIQLNLTRLVSQREADMELSRLRLQRIDRLEARVDSLQERVWQMGSK